MYITPITKVKITPKIEAKISCCAIIFILFFNVEISDNFIETDKKQTDHAVPSSHKAKK